VSALARGGFVSLAAAVVLLLPFPARDEARRSSSSPATRTAPPPFPFRQSEIDSLEREGRLQEATRLALADVVAAEAARAEPAAVVRARRRLADLYVEQGLNRAAIEVIERAMEIRVPGPRRDPVERAAVFIALARAEKNEGLYAAATAHYDSALGLARSAGEAGRETEARTMIGVAHLIRRTPEGRPRAARLLEDALRILESRPGTEAGDLASARSGLALVLLQLGDAARAESLLALSVPATLAQLGPAHPNVGLAHSLWGWSQYLLGRYARAEVSFRSAMRTYERAHRHLSPGANQRRVLQRVAINLAGAQLAQGRGTEAWESLETGLSSYLPARLAEDPAGSGFGGHPPRDAAEALARLRREMGERSAVIGWVEVNLVNEAPRDVWAFVIRREGPVRWVRNAAPAPDAAMTGPTWDLSEVLERDAGWPTRVLEERDAIEAGRAAWAERIAPFESMLEGVDQLIVLNAWTGAEVPIEAFVDGAGRLLLDRFEVTYAPSVGSYLALRDRARARGRSGDAPALLVGDAVEPQGRRTGTGLARLPGARRELERIAALLPHATVLTGTKARTLRRLGTSAALGRYGMLHFATHATTDPRMPGGGALLLGSGDGTSGADSSARITASEIETWRLHASLVTLSGCRTSGQHSFGTAPGLAESFLVAGATGTVVSLRPTDDRASALLMGRFYENLIGAELDPPAALRAAKSWLREYRDEHGQRPFRNPAYWSGFVFIGACEGRAGPL